MIFFFSEARPVSQFHRWEVIAEGGFPSMEAENRGGGFRETQHTVIGQRANLGYRSENQICLDKVGVVPGKNDHNR